MKIENYGIGKPTIENRDVEDAVPYDMVIGAAYVIASAIGTWQSVLYKKGKRILNAAMRLGMTDKR